MFVGASWSFTSWFTLARFPVPPQLRISFRAEKTVPWHHHSSLRVQALNTPNTDIILNRKLMGCGAVRSSLSPLRVTEGSVRAVRNPAHNSVLRHAAPGSVWAWRGGLGSTAVRSLCPPAWPLRFYSPAPTALCLWLGPHTAGAGLPAPSSGQKMKSNQLKHQKDVGHSKHKQMWLPVLV